MVKRLEEYTERENFDIWWKDYGDFFIIKEPIVESEKGRYLVFSRKGSIKENFFDCWCASRHREAREENRKAVRDKHLVLGTV